MPTPPRDGRRAAGPSLALLVLLAAPATLIAQGEPVGPEFRVNTNTMFAQIGHSIASDSTGNFVIVWESWSLESSGYQIDVLGQRYASSGVPLGGEFRVNTYTTGNQSGASVTSDAAGNFVVTWSGRLSPESDQYDVFARRFSSTGAPLGGEFQVNTYTTGHQFVSSLASDATGNFVVAWTSYGQDGGGYGIFAQRYASTGAPLGAEFRVNIYTTSTQRSPAVAADPAGNFVVVWNSLQDGSGYGIFSQRYASTGAPLGGEFRVNSFTSSHQRDAAVASDSSGNFVVTWESLGQDGSGSGVFGQRYASTGAPLGAEFRVNTYATSEQDDPSVISDSDGNFVVVWQRVIFDGITLLDIYSQRYASSGVALGGESRVNTYTTNNQIYPSVASDLPGHFVVAWTSCWTQDGSGCGVYAQRYSMIVPVELQSFGVE